MSEDARQSSPSTARNREPILQELKRVLPYHARVLEIASGAGEHAVYFATEIADLEWQPSDPDAGARASVAAWTEVSGLKNVRAPLPIDAAAEAWGVERYPAYDAVVCCNMIHISPWESALGLVAGAGRVLRQEGVLFLYGPFMRDGQHTAPSNEAFDASLKSRDKSWGIRDLADVERAANAKGLTLQEIVDMPANNFSVIFVKR